MRRIIRNIAHKCNYEHKHSLYYRAYEGIKMQIRNEPIYFVAQLLFILQLQEKLPYIYALRTYTVIVFFLSFFCRIHYAWFD